MRCRLFLLCTNVSWLLDVIFVTGPRYNTSYLVLRQSSLGNADQKVCPPSMSIQCSSENLQTVPDVKCNLSLLRLTCAMYSISVIFIRLCTYTLFHVP